MRRKTKHSYVTISVLFIIGLLLFWHLMLLTYVVVYPQRIPFNTIRQLTFGRVKTVGRVMTTSYGQVDFSKVMISDGTGEVNVLFGLYARIEDPEKIRRRDNLPLDRLSKKTAIKELNKPVHYDSIEVVGIYYPITRAVYAYYLNGGISGTEYFIIITNFLATILFIYAAVASLVTNRS